MTDQNEISIHDYTEIKNELEHAFQRLDQEEYLKGVLILGKLIQYIVSQIADIQEDLENESLK